MFIELRNGDFWKLDSFWNLCAISIADYWNDFFFHFSGFNYGILMEFGLISLDSFPLFTFI